MNKIIAVVLAVFLFFLLSGYEVKTYPELAAEVPNPLSETVAEQQGYARSLLDERRRQLYDIVKVGLQEGQADIAVRRTNYVEQDIVEVLWAVKQDSPGFFWVDWTSWEYTMKSDGISIRPTYLDTGTARQEKARQLEEACDVIVGLAAEAGAVGDYDKVLFVHDYLIDHIEYLEEGPSDIHSAYGALVGGEAVCDGYAHAFQLLLNAMDVECFYIEGYTKGSAPGVGHAWNMVNIDGRYHLVDVTWDDADLSGAENWVGTHVSSYWYFLLSTEEMALTHTDTSPYEMPRCERYGFFETVGLSGPTAESIRANIINNAAGKAKKDVYYVEFEVRDPQAYDHLRNNMDSELGAIVNGINDVLADAGSSLRYKAVMLRGEATVDGWMIRLLFNPDED